MCKVMDPFLWWVFYFVLLFKLQSATCCKEAEADVVIVDEISKEIGKCCKEHDDLQCKSWNNTYEDESNVTIIIYDDCITISQVLYFIDVSNILIEGQLNSSTIKCTGMAGLYFERASEITLSHIILTNCGINSSSYNSAIIFNMSSNIDIFNVVFKNSNSSGMTLLDCYEQLTLTSVTFANNRQACDMSEHKYGALNIVIMNSNYPGDYVLQYCVFESNENEKCGKNTDRVAHPNGIRWGNSRLGGGMTVIIADSSFGHHISLDYCQFTGNNAIYGGGLYLQLQNSSQDNIMTINNTIFQNNNASYGGGLNINFVTDRNVCNTNKIKIENTRFESNKANSGGGLSVTISYSNFQNSTEESMIFRNCTWVSNEGTLISPAVDITPYVPRSSERYGFLLAPLFRDISVSNNFVEEKDCLLKTQNKNSGVFLVTGINVTFIGEISFQNNSPSALQAVSSGIILKSFTTMTFTDNRGLHGAAIALYGFSYIYLSKHVELIFQNNTATASGGGIYYHGIDQHELMSGFNCFIEIEGGKTENISMKFENNKAENGKWIYSDSFYTCIHHCYEYLNLNYTLSSANITRCLVDITSPEEQQNIASSAKNFDLTQVNESYSVVPGERFLVPFYAYNELSQNVSPLISLDNRLSSINFKEPYIVKGSLVALGLENSTTTVTATVIGLRSIYFNFKLKMKPCSPGFMFRNNSCVCGHNASGYQQILWCDMKHFTAYLDKEYWVGYIPSNVVNDSNLYFVPCLGPICNTSLSHLPRDAMELNDYVCGANRNGIMCGMCVENYTVYFHSKTYSCGTNEYCKYGPLFYFLSEIIPLVFFFLIAIVFDLTFTSGKFVGFLFFCQYFENIILQTDSRPLEWIQLPYKLFYGIFSMEYFMGKYIAYCLWKNLDTQDIIAIKYFSVVFSLALVLILLVLLRTGQCSIICDFRKQISQKQSFLHGLSALLAICYIQCTKTSFLILRFAIPQGLNGKRHQWFTYYGGLPYFQGKHLGYGIVAICSLMFVTIIPAAVLLLHPLFLQLLSICHLSEHWLVYKILKIFQIQSLVPFLDCFQSCYKDRCRFFAGLYFVYRVALLICFMTTDSFSNLLLYVQLLLSLFLGIHAVVHPYKEKLHNILDSLLFLNLNVINLLNIYIYNHIKDFKLTRFGIKDRQILEFEIVQTLLMYLPMLVCLIWLLRKLPCYFRMYRQTHTREDYNVLHQDEILQNYKRCNISPCCRKQNNSELCDCSN